MKVPDGLRPGQEMSPRVLRQLNERRGDAFAGFRRDAGRETALLLLLATALVLLAALGITSRRKHYDGMRPDEHATYWMESAQRFRYVSEVASGRDIPEVDRMMQAPAGYETQSDTLLQERIYGGLARIASIPQDELAAFVRLLTRLLGASIVVPLYLLALAVTGRRDASLIAAAIVALSRPVTERATGVTLFREDLAVPLLAWHLMFLGAFARRSWLPWAAGSAGSLAAAALCWKVVPFWMIFVAAWFVLVGMTGRARPAPLAAGAALHVLMLVGATELPLSPLSWAGFYGSWAFHLWIGATVGLTLAALPKVPVGATAVMAVGVAVAVHQVAPAERGLDHAWETLLARLRVGFQKPEDPSLLPFHARHYWTGNYQSPSVARLVRDWPALVLVALPGVSALVRSWRRTTNGPEPQLSVRPAPVQLFDGWGPMDPLGPATAAFALWFLAAGIGSYLLFSKLQWMASIVLCVPIAIALARQAERFGRARLLLYALGGVAVLQGFSVLPTFERFLPEADSAELRWSAPQVQPAWAFSDLATQLPRVVPDGEPVLASFVVSPFILAYSDRPTLLHCFFEGDLLDRFRRLTEARFEDEDSYWRVVREEGARWVLVEAHMLLRDDPRMSERYVADAMTWPAGSAAARMHFAPETLRHFELTWENPWFRLYRVLEPGAEPVRPTPSTAPLWSGALARALGFDPIDPAKAGATDGGAGASPAGAAASGPVRPSDLLFATLSADEVARAPRLGGRALQGPLLASLERSCQIALERAPFLMEAYLCLAEAQMGLGKADAAAATRALGARWGRALRGEGAFPSDPRPARVELD